MVSTRVGGRPRQLELDGIVRVGRRIGMRRLSLNAVATELGVTSAALYRHVENRWGLESLVGESILAELNLHDDDTHDVTRHLLSFGLQLRTHILDHPGLAAYLQTLFPRGDAGRGLLTNEVQALARRGYSPDAAVVLASATASVTIGYAAAEELQLARADGLPLEQQAASEQLGRDPQLGAAHESLPTIDAEMYVRLMLTAAIGGFVGVAPPGRPVAEIIAELDSIGRGA